MALTKIQGQNIANSAISTNKVDSNFTATYATYAAVAANLTPRITTVNVANSSYTVLDDVAVNTSGGYLVITGANFQSGAIVTIENSQATSTTYVNDTTLRAQVAAKNAGSYVVYVQNPDGGTAIRVNGVTFSNTPVWGTAATLSNQAANTAFAVSISANSDSNVTYSNTTSLPAGTTLLANGLFYGTVTIGAETVYSFDVRATDAELQDTPRTFSLTVTVTPQLQLWSWGRNSDGSLGLGDTVYKSSPVQVGSNTTWNNINNGYFVSLAIKTDGTLWSWGVNSYGQLGFNDRVDRSSPTQVGSSTNWSKAVSGTQFCGSIKTDGTLWLWGRNNYGRLGLGDTIHRSSPTQVGSNTNWSIFNLNGYNSRAIKTDGTLWSWGPNPYGQLGLNQSGNGSSTTYAKSSPTQVGTNTNWSKIASCGGSTIGIKTDGTLWAWGETSFGQLGLNAAGNYARQSSPTQVGSSTNWDKITSGSGASHFLATKTDGTLWGWGYNAQGGLGLDNYTHRSSPTQVGANTNWNIISASSSSGAAIKTDGTLWVWGDNQGGRLGLNSISSVLSPVQVGSSTNWSNVSVDYHTMALKSA
jgi:alpha-tubulin suppressor-like RCC1 family protein